MLKQIIMGCMNQPIKIIPFQPENQVYQKKFLEFPFLLYDGDPNWVPPLRLNMRNLFNRKKHGFYNHGEAQFLLAMRGDRTVGRLVMLHNRGPISGKVQEIANFFLFEV